MKSTANKYVLAGLLIGALLNWSLLTEASATKNSTALSDDCISLGMEDSFGTYARADGTGMSRDIVEAAFKAAKVCVKFNVMRYAKIVEDVKKGELLGGFGVAKQYNTTDDFIFGRNDLFKVRNHFYVLKGRKNDLVKKGTRTPAKRAEDLIGSGIEIGTINGYEYGRVVDSMLTRVDVNTQEQNYKKLLDGRIKVALFFENEIKELRETLKQQGEDMNNKIEIAFEGTPSVIHVGFSKGQGIRDEKERAALVKKSLKYAALLDKGMDELRKHANINGKKSSLYKEITAKYDL